MLNLINHLYRHYPMILATIIVAISEQLREIYYLDDPLERLYTRFNECVDYATSSSEPIIEGQLVRIAYGLVVETGKSQEDCHIWRVKAGSQKNPCWTSKPI